MTAVVSRERAKATWLTGVAGLLILAAAWAMMVCAAPSLAYPRPHPAVTRAASEVSVSVQITEGRPANGAGTATTRTALERPARDFVLGQSVLRIERAAALG